MTDPDVREAEWKAKLKAIGFYDTLVKLVDAFDHQIIKPASQYHSYSGFLHESGFEVGEGDGSGKHPLHLIIPSFDALLIYYHDNHGKRHLVLPPSDYDRQTLASAGLQTIIGAAPEWYCRLEREKDEMGETQYVVTKPEVKSFFFTNPQHPNCHMALASLSHAPHSTAGGPPAAVTHQIEYVYPEHRLQTIVTFAADPHRARQRMVGERRRVLNSQG